MKAKTLRQNGPTRVTTLIELVQIIDETLKRGENEIRNLDIDGIHIGKFIENLRWVNCNFMNCNLLLGIFKEDELEGCSFDRCDFENGGKSRKETFTDAKLWRCSFTKTDLVVRNPALWDRVAVERCRLWAAFRGTKIEGGRFVESNLNGCDFENVTLNKSIFVRCDMDDVVFSGSMMSFFSMSNCESLNARFDAARISEGSFLTCSFSGANFGGSKLSGVDFSGVNLRHSDFAGSDLKYGKFLSCDMSQSEWIEGTIEGTGFEKCDAEDAVVENMVLNNTNFDDMFGGDAIPAVATGRPGRAIARMRALPGPVKVGKFKRDYADVFAAIQGEVQNLPRQEITPAVVEKLIAKFGFEWQVSKSQYSSELQRLSPVPNDVLQLNLSITKLAPSPEDQKILNAVRDLSTRSGHPVRKSGDLWTIGWVRYNAFPETKTVLIEEVQSDVPAVRMGLKDPSFKSQMASRGLEPQEVERAISLLMPFAERFYEDAMSLVFDEARKEGYEVEMLTHVSKKAFRSPVHIYEQLPKSMGMRKRQESATIPRLPEVWHVIPNRRRA
jgi:uncharacterized protein YjbI with pentapeptide repeats